MGLPTKSLPVAGDRPSFRLGHLLAVLMTLAFVVVDQYLLNFQEKHPPDGPGTALLWLLFVSQVAVIGVVGAHLVQRSWQGWAVYAWAWVAVDLQVLWAVAYITRDGVATECLLLTALLAAQLGLVVIWSILGEQQWTIRIPLLLGLAIVMTFLLHRQIVRVDRGFSYSLLFLIQILSLYAVCSLLRYRGFCLSQPGGAPRQRPAREREQPMPAWQLPAFRFGMREFIVASVLVAVILLVLQYNIYAGPPTGNEPLHLAFATVLTALTMAVAFWSALGSAGIEVRIAGLLATCFLSAGGFIVSDAIFGDRYYEFHNSSSVWHFWSAAFASRSWVYVWMFLSGGLLSAALLLLRMLGYRLQRVAPGAIDVGEVELDAAGQPGRAYALLALARGNKLEGMKMNRIYRL